MGERLKSITNEMPKPLIKIGEKPLIQITIESLKRVGVEKIVVILNYKKAMIKNYLNSTDWGIEIQYVYPDRLEGLAYSVLSAKDLIDRIMIMHLPDNIFITDYDYVLEEHIREKASATLLVEEGGPEDRYETILLEENRVRKIYEKAKFSYGYRGTGLYIFEPEIFDYCGKIEKSERGELEIQDAIEGLIKDDKKVIGVKIRGRRFEITTEEDVRTLRNLKLNL